MIATLPRNKGYHSLLVTLLGFLIIGIGSVRAYAELGDLLDSFVPSPLGNGRAVAFDPATGELYYTITGSTNIFITDASNVTRGSINPGVLCGALSWDGKRGLGG